MTISDQLKPDVILHGEQLFEAAMDAIISQAEHELLIFDADLQTARYGSRARIELMRSFLAKSRSNRLILLLHHAEPLAMHCPRLMELVKLHSHTVFIHKTGEEAHIAQDSFALADGLHYLHRFHVDHARFRYSLDNPAATHQLRERFDQIMETSTHSLSATTLGL